MFFLRTPLHLSPLSIPGRDKNFMASRDCFMAFMKRHLLLSIRCVQPASFSRATHLNRHNVSQLFDNLRKVPAKHKFHAEDVWKMDETGYNCPKPSKILLLGVMVPSLGHPHQQREGHLWPLLVKSMHWGIWSHPTLYSLVSISKNILFVMAHPDALEQGMASCSWNTSPSITNTSLSPQWMLKSCLYWTTTHPICLWGIHFCRDNEIWSTGLWPFNGEVFQYVTLYHLWWQTILLQLLQIHQWYLCCLCLSCLHLL